MIDRSAQAQSALFEEALPHANQEKRKRNAAPKPVDLGLIAPSQTVKNYVLDTNVLLHDPASLERFKENHLCIPCDVLSELDKFKGEQSERGANARRVHRRLTEMFSTTEVVTKGVTNECGGTVRLVIYDPAVCPKNSELLNRFLRVFPDHQRIDQHGEGLLRVGQDLDGIVQAVEYSRTPPIIGVQWHPEYLLYLPAQLALFRWLVNEAR